MKLAHVIEYDKGNIYFFKCHSQNETGTLLVPELLGFF